MTDTHRQPALLDLPLPAVTAPRPLDDIVRRSAEITTALQPQPWNPRLSLREAIPAAEALMAACSAQAKSLREALEPMPPEDLKRAIAVLLAVWPNTSRSDLTGFGTQLVLDVVERRPCRYAIREAFRTLRQTSRFVPSIAEVLEVLDEAQSRLRKTSVRLAALPALIDDAKARQAKQDREDAAYAVRYAADCEAAKLAAADRTSGWLR